MAKRYPPVELPFEGDAPPSKFRVLGRNVTVVGAIIDGDKVYFDNGLLRGASKAEQGITFGPEVLRALGGRRVVALWLAASFDDDEKAGWFGLTVGEMRVDEAKKDGFKDEAAFSMKLQEAAKGRVSLFKMTDEERGRIADLLRSTGDLWTNAQGGFKRGITAAIPELEETSTDWLDDPRAADATGAMAEAGGVPPTDLRVSGRDVVIYGAVIDGSECYWDNGVIKGTSKPEVGITFGDEVLRAMGGRMVHLVWVCVATDEDGDAGFYGVTVGDCRIDAAKQDGFKDLRAHSLKLNEAAKGRCEAWKLKGDAKAQLAALLKAQTTLWENATEVMHDAFEG